MAHEPPPRRASIAVVGSLNVDLVTYGLRLPGPGETVIGERFVMGFGGKGANQAVMAARLDASVALIGALGDDVYGDMTIANLEAEEIAVEGIARVPGSSGVAPIWVEPDGTNRIVVVAGANARVDPSSSSAAVRSLPSLDVVIGQLEIPQAPTIAAFRAARDRGATTVLNPAPAAPLEPELVAATDWLVPNEIELEALGATAGDEASLLELARRHRAGLVVTLGPAGAALAWGGRVTRVPAPRMEVVDTTGAGDAFVGAFAVGLAIGLGPADAVRLGVACASHSVAHPGTQASFPDRRRAAELRAWAAAGGR